MYTVVMQRGSSSRRASVCVCVTGTVTVIEKSRLECSACVGIFFSSFRCLWRRRGNRRETLFLRSYG
jgi:hypothetical protein